MFICLSAAYAPRRREPKHLFQPLYSVYILVCSREVEGKAAPVGLMVGGSHTCHARIK